MDEVHPSSNQNPPPAPPGSTEQRISTKKFIFRSKTAEDDEDPLIVIIPERLEARGLYGTYVWPSANILAWYLFEHRHFLKNKKVLELGAGTSLPGILAALCGAQVTLSDSSKLPHCLDQARKSVEANGLQDRVQVIGITWGFFLSELFKVRGEVDLIIGSDVFYDPSVFEDLLCTVAYILENNPEAKFLVSYQERSSDWSIVSLLSKWNLKCQQILYNDLANSCELELSSLLQGHTIQLLEISLQKGHPPPRSS